MLILSILLRSECKTLCITFSYPMMSQPVSPLNTAAVSKCMECHLKKIKFAEFPGGGYPPDPPPPLKAQGLGTCVSTFHFPSKGVGISATFINVQSQQVCFVFCFIDRNTRATYYFCSFSYFRKSVCTVFL